MITLSDRMKQSRKALGLSQKDLALACGVSQPTIAHWERGDHAPRTEALQRLAACLQQDPVWLLSGELPAQQNPVHQHLAKPIRHYPVYDWPDHYDEIRETVPVKYLTMSTDQQNCFILVDGGQTDFGVGTLLVFDRRRTKEAGYHLVQSPDGLILAKNPKLGRLARLSHSVTTH